jgi:outer membrane protein assembly factor BamB
MSNRGALALLGVVCLAAAADAFAGRHFELVQSFHEAPARYGAHFGKSVAVLGTNALVGTPGPSNPGVAYLLSPDGAPLQTFTIPRTGLCSMTGDGTTVAIGAQGDGAIAGAVYIFDVGTGTLLRTLQRPAAIQIGGDCFGESLAFIGSNLLIGSPWCMCCTPGLAYIFDPATGTVLQTFQGGVFFGRSVAALGSQAIIGAPGEVHLFDGTSGAFVRTLQKPAPQDGWFGYAVAALGSNILVGDPQAQELGLYPGAVYVFDASTGEVLRTIHEPISGSGEFGWSVAAVGSDILVSAPGRERVYLFDGATGDLLQTLSNPTGVPQGFGDSVAATDSTIVIGAPNETTTVDGAGGAYLYQAFVCGDGVLDPGEQCDDAAANGTGTSCCTAACQFAASGTSCSGGTCDGTDHCAPVTTTTTSTTIPPQPCSTDTDCPSDDPCSVPACVAGICVDTPLSGFREADCELGKLLDSQLCSPDSVDPKLAAKIGADIRRIRALVQRAGDASVARQRARLLARARRKLAALDSKVQKATRTSLSCRAKLHTLIEEGWQMIHDLQPLPLASGTRPARGLGLRHRGVLGIVSTWSATSPSGRPAPNPTTSGEPSRSSSACTQAAVARSSSSRCGPAPGVASSTSCARGTTGALQSAGRARGLRLARRRGGDRDD